MSCLIGRLSLQLKCWALLLGVCYSYGVAANAVKGVTSYKEVTIVDIMALHERTKIIFEGLVVDQVKKKTYQVRDKTGSVFVVIPPSILGGLTILRHDKLEVRGEVDSEITGKFVVAHSIRKLKSK